MDSEPTKTSFDMLDREMCLKHWKTQFGYGPPKYASVEFMRKVFAYEAQVAAFGGHSRAVRNVLKACLKEAGRGKAKADAKAIPSPAALRPGAHLVREWNGRIHQVEVTTNGFQMDGKQYGSLTAIARKITGAAWSGPRFFGLAKT
ncbi:DUF2924 domain-containing protein [Aliirhizobium terrae]|uniref:DUF2924 domain-containing protein n=1 Tax=Terrirhizobium terrae TaxID=2926709 RepID=UPI002575F74D|nr:DUF2924 domain-containing protein [Rhizobium sp. CC-CFT758]WJH39072.1 DUF2924 domain-containing protein [Rhizobium sp. CC-CFT758]